MSSNDLMPLSYRSASEPPVKFRRAALVVGHPGHELRVFGWMSEYKPRVYVITDGSGHHGFSRTSSTALLLSLAGASPGEVFGSISDVEIYRAMLEQDLSVFFHLLEELAGSFLKHQIDCVVGDAVEGFNPTHDLCRGLINAAVLLAGRMNGMEIMSFEISLTEWEQGCPRLSHDDRCWHWVLDDRKLARKIAAAEQYTELKDEVRHALAQRGAEYFRTECLRRSTATEWPYFGFHKPAYETWGEQRVAAGQYHTVIRFQQHILPILKAIRDRALLAALDPALIESRQ